MRQMTLFIEEHKFSFAWQRNRFFPIICLWDSLRLRFSNQHFRWEYAPKQLLTPPKEH